MEEGVDPREAKIYLIWLSATTIRDATVFGFVKFPILLRPVLFFFLSEILLSDHYLLSHRYFIFSSIRVYSVIEYKYSLG